MILGPDGEPAIVIQYPLNQFAVGETFTLKKTTWTIADVRNRLGMILSPADKKFDPVGFWSYGELIPLRGYWFRVAVVGIFGCVLQPIAPTSGETKSARKRKKVPPVRARASRRAPQAGER